MRRQNRGQNGLKIVGFTLREQASVKHCLDPNYEPDRPAIPTDARPGTEAKIEVLAERVRRRQPLWVDGDPTAVGSRRFQTPEWVRSYRGSANDPRMIDRE